MFDGDLGGLVYRKMSLFVLVFDTSWENGFMWVQIGIVKLKLLVVSSNASVLM